MDNPNNPNGLEQIDEIKKMNQTETGYYANKDNKIRDFILGLFGPVVISIFLMSILTKLSTYGSFFLEGYYFSAISIILFIIMLASIYVSFRKKRRYIGIGLISFFILPFLLFGACMMIFTGFN